MKLAYNIMYSRRGSVFFVVPSFHTSNSAAVRKARQLCGSGGFFSVYLDGCLIAKGHCR